MTPTSGMMPGVSCNWKDDSSSAAQVGGVFMSASSDTGVPILPTSAASCPNARRRWPISAVVVVLPLVPVTAM